MTRVVIVGAGSAGMTAAWRLSRDPGVEVVLVEAGSDPGPDVPVSLRREFALPEKYYWPYAEAETGEFLARGKVLGGSSAANYAGATRGRPWSYDGWGLPDWTWDRCLPAFRAIEADQDFGDRPYHGAAGPTPVVRRPIGPADEGLMAGYGKHGHRQVDDHNAPEAIGFGPFPANRLGEDRASTLLTMLPDLRERANVTVRADCEVVRILIAGGRAQGVEIQSAAGQGASPEVVEGDVVLLSAGVYGSPEILVRSGVGPAEVLHRRGIPVVADSAEVGQNLRDHPLLLLNVESRIPLPPSDPLLLTLELPGGPDRLAHVFPFVGLVPGLPPTTASFVCALLSPASRGFLDLGQRQTGIHLNHFTEPEDRSQAADLVARAADLLDSLAADDLVTLPDDPWWRGDVGAVARRSVAGYNHPIGTCRMGMDDESVVDQALQVRGIGGLLVADASVLPDIPRSQTNLPSMMIGYRAAEFIAAGA